MRPAFYARPHWSRRQFFQLAGASMTAGFLAERHTLAADGVTGGAQPKGTARNVIFIMLGGAPSQTDTFDFRMTDGVTPKSFAPETINGVLWPMGLLPKLGAQLSDFAIIRSMRAHALEHALMQTWVQIGRNPAVGPNSQAPHIGTVVAIEKDKERTPDQKFPTFLALNGGRIPGAGYMPASKAPFKVMPGRGGIDNTKSAARQDRFTRRWNLMHSIDDTLRTSSPYGKAMEDYADFYSAAQGLTYNSVVDDAFSFSAVDSARYGGTTTGNSCLIAYQVLKAQQGTRFIQVSAGDNWDMHYSIYTQAVGGLPIAGKNLDNAVSALISDLKSSGLYDSTLIVMLGEFGRTVGPLTPAQGRDHYPQQFAFFAGGGVKGGTIIGKTTPSGADVAEFGWSRNRYVWVEDIEATIYSALGIDWTYIRHDDPLHRGFNYVPLSEEDYYVPVHELWG
jgi:hypothetical protein